MLFKGLKKAILLLLVLFLIAATVFALCKIGSKNAKADTAPPQSEASEKPKYPTVIIDAGHGGEDGGAVGIDGTLEKDLNLLISIELAELLRADGFEVRLTREEDILLYDRNSDFYGHKKEQDMAARLDICKEYTDAVFISIHMNSFTESKYKGLQVYYSPSNGGSAALADSIQSAVARNLQSDNHRRTKPSDGKIYLLDKNIHPSVLVECGFLTNAEDCKALSDPDYRQRLCMVLFSAIENYIENNRLTDG